MPKPASKIDALPAHPVATAIYAGAVQAERRRRSRRLGASVIGKACDRAIWYDFRWATTEAVDGKLLRVFRNGAMAEHRFAIDLRHAGMDVEYPNEPGCTNPQDFEFTAVGGHVVAKVDGYVGKVPGDPAIHVAEFKTHNRRSYRTLHLGVAVAHPKHYAQLAVGMRLAGAKRGLYLAEDKDSNAVYAETLGEAALADADRLLERAEAVVRRETPGHKISLNPKDRNCVACPHAPTCHGDAVADVTCRSCVHATPVFEDAGVGRWRCERHDKTISADEQERACPDHLFIPDLVPFATATDSDEQGPDAKWIKYETSDGREFFNGTAAGQYRSVELKLLPAAEVGYGMVQLVKDTFGAKVIKHEEAE